MKINYFTIPLIAILVAYFGNIVTNSGLDNWYYNLNLPSIAPEGWFIGLMWTIIYILTTISVLIVWNKLKQDKDFKLIIGLFVVNAFLNFLWTYLFFGLNFIYTAFLEMIVLNIINLWLIIILRKKNLIASLLIIPYFIWVCFATYLTYLILTLN
jgi:tryptophan-rich sensory protein